MFIIYWKKINIAIVGGGLVGSLLSTYLSRQGAIVSVFIKDQTLMILIVLVDLLI